MPTTSSLVRELVDQAFNLGNLSIVDVDELILIDAVSHTPGWGMPANRQGLKQLMANPRAAFPDLYCAVDDEFERETNSAALWTLRGTHNGPLLLERAALVHSTAIKIGQELSSMAQGDWRDFCWSSTELRAAHKITKYRKIEVFSWR